MLYHFQYIFIILEMSRDNSEKKLKISNNDKLLIDKSSFTDGNMINDMSKQLIIRINPLKFTSPIRQHKDNLQRKPKITLDQKILNKLKLISSNLLLLLLLI